MGTSLTSLRRFHDAPPSGDFEWLRCPGEKAALALCIVSNIALVLIAWAAILAGSDWLAAHPFVGRREEWIRTLAIASIIALPVLPLSRQLMLHAARNDGVRVGEAQFPELHEQLLRACRKLNIEPVPELYLSRRVPGPSAAYSARGAPVIVLNADLVPSDWKEGLDWLSFAMAGALGSLRLGHTRWWVALLTGYAGRAPGLSAALFVKRTYSRDRCAAFVVPDGIRGLLVEAVGKDAVGNVSAAQFVEQSKDCRSVWDSLVALRQKTPPISARARALYDAGLFDEAKDLERLRRPAPARER
jgi:hypothetical protein